MEVAPFEVTTLADVVSADDGFLSLREALVAIDTDDNITEATISFHIVSPSTTITLDPRLGQLEINKSVTINGLLESKEHVVIDGGREVVTDEETGETTIINRGNRIFEINKSESSNELNITLENLTLQNGFIANNNGGAILINKNDYSTTITLDNVEFNNNTATNTGATTNAINGCGGALYIPQTATVNATNVVFNNNGSDTQGKYGGAVYNEGVLNVTDSSFENNRSKLGGAVFNRGTLSVTGIEKRCEFKKNVASLEVSTKKYGSGGAIYNSSGTTNVTNAYFYMNFAYKYGGAISNFAVGSPQNETAGLGLNFIEFSSNEAGAGGALHNSGVAEITDIYASDNRARLREIGLTDSDHGGNGGAIFQSNNASDKNGNISVLKLKVTDDVNTFLSNTAENAGGSIDIISGHVSFAGSFEIWNNVANVVGGAIVFASNIDENTFVNDPYFSFDDNDAPYGKTIAASCNTTDADVLKQGFFPDDYDNLTYEDFDTFVRAKSITNANGKLSLDFDFFANTSADAVTSVTVLRVDNNEPIKVVRGTPQEGEVNRVTLNDLGINGWDTGKTIDVYYCVNNIEQCQFKLTLTKAANSSLMIQQIDMDAHASVGTVGYNFRAFGGGPICKWSLVWDDGETSTHEGLGFIWNAFRMGDENVRPVTLTVWYSEDEEEKDVFTLASVTPQETTDAVLDETSLTNDFFADEELIDDLFVL